MPDRRKFLITLLILKISLILASLTLPDFINFINFLNPYENKASYQCPYLIYIYIATSNNPSVVNTIYQNKTMKFYKHYNFQFQFYAIYFEFFSCYVISFFY